MATSGHQPQLSKRHSNRTTVAKNGLQTTHHILGIADNATFEPRFIDPVLVAIDSEGTHSFFHKTARSTDTQTGSAILDTKDHALSTPLKPEILTLSLVSGPARYQRRALMKFISGFLMAIEQADLLSSSKEVIPKGRDLVLVGHGIRNELRILTSIGFDFEEMRITRCRDTYRIRAEVLPYFSPSLRELLRELWCPHNWLQNAGNDANFILQALLLLAISALDPRDRDSQILDHLEEICCSPMPAETPGSLLEKANVIEARRAKKSQKVEELTQISVTPME